MISAGYPSGNCCLDNYIPVTYPTGHLWNPYPLLLGEADVWPKGFPTELKKEPQQESLNGAMEMVPSFKTKAKVNLTDLKHLRVELVGENEK